MAKERVSEAVAVRKLRLTGRQHRLLCKHLFPGDGREAVVLALCGRYVRDDEHYLLIHRIIPIPHDECKHRHPDMVTWSTDRLIPLLQEASRRGMGVAKIHSHPGGLSVFSTQDGRSDRDLFQSIYGWMDDDQPHVSAVMLPDGRIFARTVLPSGRFAEIPLITVAGDDLQFWEAVTPEVKVPGFADRHAQLFGAETTNRLRRLSAAVVGCSGTGSPVIEQLARLGIGRLVLVDSDVVKVENLNRILNSTYDDAIARTPKVDVASRAVRQMGLGTLVEAIPEELATPRAVKAVAGCDVIFGCMDRLDGRQMLNRLAAFYLVPYFDLGVGIDADGKGGVNQVCGAVHYLQPDGSSLMTRGVVNPEALRAEAIKKASPNLYEDLLAEGYIRGVVEQRPAVIALNTLFASRAILELLARLHPFRLDPNADFAIVRETLTVSSIIRESDGEPCPALARYTGRGDIAPLLDMPELSERI